MNNLEIFTYNNQGVRTVIKDGQPWFVAKDVCDILEISNNRDAVSRLDDDEKGVDFTDTPGGSQQVIIISESGLYSLVLTSNKPEAKQFKRWITHEVIPSIRKSGSYGQPMTHIRILQNAIQVLAEQEQRMQAIESQVQTVNHRINNLDLTNIDGTPRQRLSVMIRKYAYDNGIPHQIAWHTFVSNFNRAYGTNLESRKNHFLLKSKRKTMTMPEYMEFAGLIEDAVRVADKMLNHER